MKIPLLVCAASLVLVGVAAAQDTPHYEVFLGGSYVRVHANGAEVADLTNVSADTIQAHNANFNLYGWDASLTENVNSWFGAELDFSGLYGAPSAGFLFPASQLLAPKPDFSKRVAIMTQYQTYMFGPRFTRRRGAFVPFAHLLIGAAHVKTSLDESAVVASDLVVLPSQKLAASTALAVSPGVGLDVRLRDRLSIRAFELDYLMTRSFGQRQDNARVSVGLIFNFGEK